MYKLIFQFQIKQKKLSEVIIQMHSPGTMEQNWEQKWGKKIYIY